MNNKQIAKLLRSVAAAYEVKGADKFKVAAYERAATAVEHATSDLKNLWDDGELSSLAGVGASIASHLDELFRTGKVKHFQLIMKGLPPAMFVFLDLPGVGPKTAFKLCQKLGIISVKNALSRLKIAAKKGKIKKIPGFGGQSEKDILRSLAEEKKRQKENRMLLPFAWELAERIIHYMKEEKAVLRVDPLGSLRRMAATIGDVDLAVATKRPAAVIKHFIDFKDTKRILASGQNTARILLENGRQVDLKTQKPKAYGALLQHFTGSKQHNISLREIAQKKGMSLSEYGIKKSGRIQAFADEKSFYHALDMVWIPPELREDTGEIEAARKNQLPNLIRLADIKGDLHSHSNFPIETSHDEGADSMLEMAQEAVRLGYDYFGFTEHNPSISHHTQNQILSIIKRKKYRIDKLNYSFKKNVQNKKIHLLNGLEIDIRPSGDLAVPEKGLELLDYAVASIHSSFRMSKKKMTQRILLGLNHPRVKILGHPTGRKLGEREGYELDWDKIFAF